MSGVRDLARALGGEGVAKKVDERDAAQRKTDDSFTHQGFAGDDARFVFDLFDGIEYSQETTASSTPPTPGLRQIPSRIYSRLLSGVEQGDPDAVALYEACEHGNGDADAIEEYVARKLASDPVRRPPRRIDAGT